MLTCPLWGLTNWEWGNLPTCRSFAQAEYLAHYKYWAEAVQIYNSLTEQQPDQPLFLFQLARSLEEIGHLSESVQQAKLCRLKCEDRKETEALRAVLSFLGTVYKELGDNAEMLSCWKDAANLGDAIAVDELSNYFSEEADLESWMQVHLTTGSDACSKTIRRQSVLSKWHTTFSLAADVCNKTDFLIQSYKKAIRVISRNRDDSLMNCGCRFWLAKAYAYKLQRHGTALKLFRAIFGVLVTLIEHYGWQGSERTNLQVLTLHEISTLQSILRDQTVVEEAQNIKRIIEYERVIISLGKGMERYPDQAEKAHQLYQKVLRRSITYLTDGDFHLDNYVCLGNALIALGNYKDGAWACSMRCTSQTPPSSDSSSSGDEEKSTDERLPVFEWNGDFCNNCVILSNYTSTPEIEGYRYKCLVCAGMDLCEKCYLVFKEEKSESIALRDCKPDHEFLKLPTADWSREDSDAASKNRATPHIRQRLAKIAEMYRRIL
jgi:tetratricopeptide (TPR) repeat protein